MKPEEITYLEMRKEMLAAKEGAAFWEKACERERAQRQLEIGMQEYRGNTVSYIYDKAKCYGDMVHGCSPALTAAGFPPDKFAEDGAVGAIARAVNAMAEALAKSKAACDHNWGEANYRLKYMDVIGSALGHPHRDGESAAQYANECAEIAQKLLRHWVNTS